MKDKFKVNILIEALRNIYSLLDAKQRKKGIFVFFLLFINAGIDVIGLGIIYPLIDAALNPDLIQQKIYLKFLYDGFGVNDSMTFVLVLSFLVLGILIIKNIAVLGITYIQTNYSHQVALRLNKKMFQYYYEQGFLFLKNENSGIQLHNIKIAPYYFAGPYFMQTLLAITELVVILFIVISLLIYSPQVIILFLFIVLPFFLVFYYMTKSTVKRIGIKKHDLEMTSTALLLESMRAFIDFKLSNKENKILSQFLFYQKNIFRLAVKERIYNNVPRQFYDVVLVIGVITLLIANWLLANNNVVLTSTLSIFALSAYRLIPAIGKIFAAMLIIEEMNPQIIPLLIVSNYKPTKFTTIQPLPIHQSIAFKNISFFYPGAKEQPILKKISFCVNKGETVGLIGVSGSGKTTLIHLLIRLIKESYGYIEIDGKRLDAVSDAAFQKNIGYVQQDVFIKDGTIIENIAFGEGSASINQARLQKAIKGAMLTDFIASHSAGLNMMLGENGVKLSGGQKQRVGIARALYKQADILVFDEATSALDMETEAAIVKTINRLAKTDKTIFIVAHRITTLSSCDRIYELENGQVARIIKYKELFNEKIYLS